MESNELRGQYPFIDFLKKIALIIFRRPFFYLSLCSYILSLCFVGFYFGDSYDPVRSLTIMVGAIKLIFTLTFIFAYAFVGDPAWFIWFANPVFYLAITAALSANAPREMAAIFAFVALLIGLRFLVVDEMYILWSGGEVAITGYGLGYMFWLWAFALMLFDGIQGLKRKVHVALLFLLETLVIVNLSIPTISTAILGVQLG